MKIVIVDYGMGNLGSIKNMLKKIGYVAEITSDINMIGRAEKIILPGVGSFDQAMQNLERINLVKILNHKVLVEKIPTLGICLGMQIMATQSEEGVRKGLNWFNAQVVRFRSDSLKIPHMGWNHLTICKQNTVMSGFTTESRFYFVHSYHFECNDTDDVLSTTEYGMPFVSGIAKENITGVQFHPEKSHKYGMLLMKNFAQL